MNKCSKILDVYSKYSSRLIQYGYRRPNFPEGLSEQLALLCLENKYKYKKFMKGKTGDIVSNDNKKIEVKCFTSTGPISFGPTEKWDSLVFVDGTDYIKKHFIVYEFPYSNTSLEIQQLLINKKERFCDQSKKGRRPRLCFDKFYIQHKTKLEIIFDGYVMSNKEKVDIFLQIMPKNIQVSLNTFMGLSSMKKINYYCCICSGSYTSSFDELYGTRHFCNCVSTSRLN